MAGRVRPRIRRELNNGTYFEDQARTNTVAGIPGTPGIGVPVGGGLGAVLRKRSSGDFDTDWESEVHYTQVTSTPYTITAASLVFGVNIFGVNVAGPASIILPASIDTAKLIVIDDESGNAGTNSITITTAP